MTRVLELFAGIGACSKALTNLGIAHEVVDAVEIDKYALASFNAIHGTNFEPQDITKWEKEVGQIDVLMHGSPCQDFSVAGLGKGGDKGSGTRSSLMYESLRIINEVKPRIVVWENVKAVLSKKHRHNFDNYLMAMEHMGYTNYYQVLNAKDYGVPQNRERVFTVSIKGRTQGFQFPVPIPLEKRLKDILEPEVDESFYLADEQVKRIKLSTFYQAQSCTQEGDAPQTLCARGFKDPKCVKVGDLDIKGQDCIKRVYSPEGISPTLTTMGGGKREPKLAFVGGIGEKDWAKDGKCLSRNYPQGARVYSADGLSSILSSQGVGGVGGYSGNYQLPNMRVRKLTPKECWKLMGFDDEDYEKAAKVNSKTQLYKQAGNSIVVNVLEAIFKEMFGYLKEGEVL